MSTNDNTGNPADTAAQQGPVDDVLAKVATAMATAADAVKTGAADAQGAVGRMAPKASLAISKTIYATSYYLSYGVVFPTMMVVSLIPKNNALCHGFSDGARAASEAVGHLRAAKTEPNPGAEPAMAPV